MNKTCKAKNSLTYQIYVKQNKLIISLFIYTLFFPLNLILPYNALYYLTLISICETLVVVDS